MEINSKPHNTNSYHLAGIVPCAGQPLDFGMEWPDFMMPVAANYTMLEAAIYECAYAGCETIWVVLHADTAPFVRHRIGDFIQDPVWAFRKHDPYPDESRRRIPIFYVPIHPKDRDRRDCLSWSVIQGALTCLKVSSKLSKWLIPDRYWVSFPYGIFNPAEIREHRSKISSNENFYVTYNGQAMNENHFTSFSFGKDEFIRYRRNIRTGTGMYADGEYNASGAPSRVLPAIEQYSARWFDLKYVFTELDITPDNSYEPKEFFNLGSWEDYRNYLSSEYSLSVKRPHERIIKYSEFQRIALDRSD